MYCIQVNVFGLFVSYDSYLVLYSSRLNMVCRYQREKKEKETLAFILLENYQSCRNKNLNIYV